MQIARFQKFTNAFVYCACAARSNPAKYNVADAGRDRYQFKDYPESVLKRLLAIRQIKEYGFTLQETLAMLILFEEGVLEPERGIRYVRRKIDRIDQKIAELLTVKSRLQEVIDKSCTGDCPIDKALNEAFA